MPASELFNKPTQSRMGASMRKAYPRFPYFNLGLTIHESMIFVIRD